MKIRKAKICESKKISNLITNTIKKILSKEYAVKQKRIELECYTPKKINNYFKTKTIFVLLDKEKIIGASMIDLKEKEIESVYLNPNYINKGLGKKLFMHTENYAKRKGIKKLTLYPTNFALNFYKKLGYKIKRRFIGTKNGGYPVIEMEKRLK